MNNTKEIEAKSEQRSRNYATLCVCAVRYALGRQTYMPGLVCDIIRNSWNKISTSDLDIIRRDICEYSGSLKQLDNSKGVYGDRCDFETWVKMADDIEYEIEMRHKYGC